MAIVGKYNAHIKGNTFKNMDEIPYKIISFMIENNQNIFKLLKYSNSDTPLEEKDLTIDEKIDMIYKGGSHAEDYNIFLQPSMDDAVTKPSCQLRLYQNVTFPENEMISLVTYNIELICHNKINTIRKFVGEEGNENSIVTTRLATMQMEVLNLLHQAEIGGVGGLFFENSNSNRQCQARLNISNNKDYFGYTCVLALRLGSAKNKSYR